MFSPHLFHPILLLVASVVEYMSGRIPSLYKLSGFVKLTMENLIKRKEKKEKGKNEFFIDDFHVSKLQNFVKWKMVSVFEEGILKALEY